MKTPKIVPALAALALAASLGISAATTEPAKTGPAAQAAPSETETAKMTAAEKDRITYGLTDEQYEKVRRIRREALRQSRALANDETKKAKQAEINNQIRAKIREILTPEQQVKFDEIQGKAAKARADAKAKAEAKAKAKAEAGAKGKDAK